MIGNTLLLKKALEHATTHPEELRQDEWAIRKPSCGTAGCIAYWITVLAGHEIDWSLAKRGSPGTLRAMFTTDGDHIADVAEREAGLTEHQADRLFSGDNTLGQLWELAAEFTDGEISRESPA